LDQGFFPSYRKTLIGKDELLRAVQIPFSRPQQFFRAFKQAQRREDDIAIVTGAFWAEFEFDGQEQMANGHSAQNGGTLRKTNHFIITQFPTGLCPNGSARLSKLRMAFGGVGPTTRMAKCSMDDDRLKGMRWDGHLLEEISRRLAQEFCLPEDVPGGMAKSH
jgi:xanthine dehydrogenase/oxidase